MKPLATSISEATSATEPGLEDQNLSRLEQLPAEIITIIAGFLSSAEDLDSLAWTSRALYAATYQIWLKRSNQSKKRYLQALQLYGSDTANAVHFMPYIKNLREENVSINWNKLYSQLPWALKVDTTSQSDKIPLLKKQHPDWFLFIKENTSEANELLQVELNKLGPENIHIFTSLLFYAARRGWHQIVPTILTQCLGRIESSRRLMLTIKVLEIAATSSYGQTTEKQKQYTALIEYLLGQLRWWHWWVGPEYSVPAQLEQHPLSRCLMVLIAQGNLELYKRIIESKHKEITDPLITLIQNMLLKQSIAYGRLDFVQYIIPVRSDGLENAKSWNTNPADLVYYAIEHRQYNILSALTAIQDNNQNVRWTRTQKRFKKAFKIYMLDAPLNQDDMIKDVLVNFLFFNHSESFILKKQRKKPQVQWESLLWYLKATKHFSDLPPLPLEVERRIMMLILLSMMTIATPLAILLFFTIPLLPILLSTIAYIIASNILTIVGILLTARTVAEFCGCCLRATTCSGITIDAFVSVIITGAALTILFCLAPGLPTLISTLGVIALISGGLIVTLFPIRCLGFGRKEEAVTNTSRPSLFVNRVRTQDEETQEQVESAFHGS